MPLLDTQTTQVVSRERAANATTLSRTGGLVKSYSDIQSNIKCRVYQSTERNAFEEAGEDRVQTWALLYNKVQYVPAQAGNPFVGVTVTVDIIVGDRVRTEAGLTYRVDSVEDCSGAGDHMEAVLTVWTGGD